jgi:hypothetical protein
MGRFSLENVGGRTNHGGASPRFGPKDFKRKDIDGLAITGPSPTNEIKPF